MPKQTYAVFVALLIFLWALSAPVEGARSISVTWAHSLSGFTLSGTPGVAADNASGAYLIFAASGANGTKSSFVVRLNSMGELAWSREIIGPPNLILSAGALGRDGTLEVFGTTWHCGAVSFCATMGSVRSNGEVLTLQQGFASMVGAADGVARTPSGAVYAAGISVYGRLYVVRAGSPGAWNLDLGYLAGVDMAPGISTELAVAGVLNSTVGFVAGLNPDMTVAWGTQMAGVLPEAVEVDGTGVYVAGAYAGRFLVPSGIPIASFSGSGQLRWLRVLPVLGVVYDLVADGSGVVAVGEVDEGNNSDLLIAKLTSAGDLEWGRRWGGPGNETGLRVVSTGPGRLIALGGSDSFSHSEELHDISLTPRAADGNLSALASLNPPTWGDPGTVELSPAARPGSVTLDGSQNGLIVLSISDESSGDAGSPVLIMAGSAIAVAAVATFLLWRRRKRGQS